MKRKSEPNSMSYFFGPVPIATRTPLSFAGGIHTSLQEMAFTVRPVAEGNCAIDLMTTF